MNEKFVVYVIIFLLAAQMAHAGGCWRPIPPYLPGNAKAIRAYSDLLRTDMEAYFSDVETYFRCVDAERAEVFVEAGRASREYGRWLDTGGDDLE